MDVKKDERKFGGIKIISIFAVMEELGTLNQFSNRIGCSIERTTELTGDYNWLTKRIRVDDSLPIYKKMTVCSHELGHALQSPQEFEIPVNPDIDDMFIFIFDIEVDAWDKGETILRKLYPNLPSEFWEEFKNYKGEALDSYFDNRYFVATAKYEPYKEFLLKAHADVKPIDLNTFTFNLELSN